MLFEFSMSTLLKRLSIQFDKIGFMRWLQVVG
jgi:hypothetical protein